MTALTTDYHVTNIIGGQPSAGSTDETLAVINPATSATLTTFTPASAEDVDRAVCAAHETSAEWSRTTPGERARLLHKLASHIEAHLDELARLEVADAGKPVSAARGEELPGILDALRHFAGAARMSTGQPAGEYAAANTTIMRREPVGVVAAITPWNFPLWQAVWKIAPALAAGNTVVIKPAENTPLSTTRFVELAGELLPPGVLNVVHGRGPVAGEALVAHPLVALVSFTGSTRAGRRIAQIAGSAPKRVILELGGNAPVAIFDDAHIETAIGILGNGALYNAGQECMSATRLLVAERVHDRVIEALSGRLRQAVIGDTFDERTTMGPLISAAQRERVEQLVQRRVGVALEEVRATGGVVLAVRTVAKGTPASKVGIQKGDLVREVNGVEVSSLDEFRRAAGVARRTGQLVLLVQRGYAAERIAFDVD